MSETIRYVADGESMGVDVPYDIFHKTAQLRYSRLLSVLKYPAIGSRKPLHTLEIDEGNYNIRFAAKRLGRIGSKNLRNQQAKNVLGAMSEIEWIARGQERGDPRLSFDLGLDGVGYGAHPMVAKFSRPSIDDRELLETVTEVMQKFAVGIGLYKKNDSVADTVGAGISTDKGYSFVANVIGSSTLDTDGMEYSPDSETVEVFSHNLYSNSMQLVCLSGLIAAINAR